MKTHQSALIVKSARLLIIVSLLIVQCPTASASLFSKSLGKVGKWVSKQSGVKDTNAKAQQSASAVRDAAKVITNIGPSATAAVTSIGRASDATHDLILSIRWPLIVAAYSGAIYLACAAVNALLGELRPARTNESVSPPARQAEPTRLTFFSRFVAIAIGSLLFFLLVFAVAACIDPSLTLDTGLTPYLATAGLRRAVAATVLSVLPLPITRIGTACGLGALAALVMFAIIAFLPSASDEEGPICNCPFEPTSAFVVTSQIPSHIRNGAAFVGVTSLCVVLGKNLISRLEQNSRLSAESAI